MSSIAIEKNVFYDELLRLYKKYGKLSLEVFRKYSLIRCGYWKTIKACGGIRKVYSDIGIPYRHGLSYCKDDIVKDFLRVYNEHGKINKELYLKYGNYSSAPITRLFGGYNNLKREVGIKVSMPRHVSKQDVIDDFLRFKDKHNTVNCTKYRRYGTYSQTLINSLFGGWRSFLNEVGEMPLHGKYGKEYMLSELKRIYNTYGFLSTKLIDDECQFTYQSLIPYFGNKDGIALAIGVKDAFSHNLSTYAQIIYDYLVCAYGESDIQLEKTWSWLRNDKTNKNMYLDFYIKSINTCIEYDGAQHFFVCNYFHKDEVGLREQQYRDKLKEMLLKQNGIVLIRFSYKDKISNSLIAQRILEHSKNTQGITNL